MQKELIEIIEQLKQETSLDQNQPKQLKLFGEENE